MLCLTCELPTGSCAPLSASATNVYSQILNLKNILTRFQCNYVTYTRHAESERFHVAISNWNRRTDLPARLRPAYAAACGRAIHFRLVKAEHFNCSSVSSLNYLQLNKEDLTHRHWHTALSLNTFQHHLHVTTVGT